MKVGGELLVVRKSRACRRTNLGLSWGDCVGTARWIRSAAPPVKRVVYVEETRPKMALSGLWLRGLSYVILLNETQQITGFNSNGTLAAVPWPSTFSRF